MVISNRPFCNVYPFMFGRQDEAHGSCKDNQAAVARVPAHYQSITQNDFGTDIVQVRFAPDSTLKIIDGFCDCNRLVAIEIPGSVEKITHRGFWSCRSLQTVVFASNSHLKVIDGFRECTSLRQIVVPASVEFIRPAGFYQCSSLREVIFAAGSRLREIRGFQLCCLLQQIAIPASVEIIKGDSFLFCRSLREFSFPAESQIKEFGGFRGCVFKTLSIPSSVTTMAFCGRAFLLFKNNNHMMQSRRRLHLQGAVRLQQPKSFGVQGCEVS
jgi:hypothetical protein